MAPGDFEKLAQALAHIAAGWRDWGDLEALARLPDGWVEIDVLAGAARHEAAGPVALRLAEELGRALAERSARKGLAPGAIGEAIVRLRADTGAIRTDRSRIVHFDFDLEARLSAEGGEYRAARREAHVWHARDPD